MQDNCKKLNLPFEVLLQGSSKNRVVRSLMYDNPNANMEICPNANVRNERNTISIYKPAITENKLQKREVSEYVEAKKNDLVEANADLVQEEADWFEKKAQHAEHDAEDAIQLALANNEDSHCESEKTLKEVEEFLAQLGIYMDDEDHHTGMNDIQ